MLDASTNGISSDRSLLIWSKYNSERHEGLGQFVVTRSVTLVEGLLPGKEKANSRCLSCGWDLSRILWLISACVRQWSSRWKTAFLRHHVSIWKTMHTSEKLSGRPCTYMEDHTPIWKGFFLEPFPSYFHVTEPLARTEGFLDYIIFVLTVVRQTISYRHCLKMHGPLTAWKRPTWLFVIVFIVTFTYVPYWKLALELSVVNQQSSF